MAATYTLNLTGVNVKTTVTNTASFIDSFITELVLSCDYRASTAPIIGFDVEFGRTEDETNNCKPATLQLCSGTRCIIIQLSRMSVAPQSLRNLLSAPLFCFVGVGVREMLLALRRFYGLECRNFIELKPVLDLALFSGCVRAEPKPLSVVMGNRGAENLGMDQIESATGDAYTFFKFGKLFFG